MIKGSNQQEDTTPNIGAQKYKKQILANKKMDSNAIIVGDFNTPLTSMNRSSRQKINKETMALNDTLDQMNLIDMYGTVHREAEYTFISSAYGIYIRKTITQPQKE